MRKFILLSCSALLLVSCHQNGKFSLSGRVKSANKQKIYLIHDDLVKPQIVDSATLDKDGDFSFSEKRPQYPDFYKLVLADGQSIVVAVDSCEEITIQAQTKNFNTDYTVSGSPATTKIQKLRQSIISIQNEIQAASRDGSSDVWNRKVEQIKARVEKHKQMAIGYIMENPASTVAYFAIYQQLNGAFLFTPYDEKDAPYCKAVATSYNAYMPEYIRSKNLYSLVMDAISKERSHMANRIWQNVVQQAGKGYIDIALKDSKNKEHKLSDLSGKVVLIDFSAYESDGSVDYTFALRELYNKYHAKGFEIYQVSADRNKQLWENAVVNLPWICVRDESGPEAECIRNYNVSSVPTLFLLTRKGDIIKRNPGFDELKKLIEKNL